MEYGCRKEVERQVGDILIKARDSCRFYEVRPNALAPDRTCFFCRYGRFEHRENMANPDGLCQLKK